MYKKTTIFLISALLFIQVSNAATVPSDPRADAIKLLNQLRTVDRDALNVAFKDHISMAMDVDASAKDTKSDSTDGILIQCVNDQAKEALDMIYEAAVGVTGDSFVPIFEDEKKIVACLASPDADCFDDVIEKLTAEIDSVPADIADQIKEDHQSIEDQIGLIEACSLIGGKSQKKAVAPRDATDDAQTALEGLRQVAITNLVTAFQDYIAIANVIDATAQEVKMVGAAVDGVTECVDTHADGAIDMIYDASVTLAKNFLKPIYDAQGQLIVCGLSDDDCINDILKDLLSKIDSTPGDVNTEVQMDSMAVNLHLTAMKACGAPA